MVEPFMPGDRVVGSAPQSPPRSGPEAGAGLEAATPLMRRLLSRALVRPSDLSSLEDCKKLSVLMPRDLHRELKTFAFRHQTTITDLILAMVVELLALEQEEQDLAS